MCISPLLFGTQHTNETSSGYSVFAVTQIDPLGQLALARTKADDLAAGIPELTSASTRISTSRTAVAGPSTSSKPDWNPEGLEDEDMELQAALLASVMGETPDPIPQPPSRPPLTETSSDKWEIRNARPAFSHPSSRLGSTPITDESLEISARRAREDLARFQEEQRQALAEGMESDDVISRILGRQSQVATTSSAPQRRAPRPRQEDEEEAEMMRRAIEASKKEAQERGNASDEEHDVSFEDDDMELDDDDEEEQAQLARLMKQRREAKREQEELDRIRQAAQSAPNWLGGVLGEDDDDNIPDAFDPFSSGILGGNAAHLDNRIYDDEDAELQAALKASLEGAPADISIPPPPKPAARAPTVDTSMAEGSAAPAKPQVASKEEDDSGEESEEEEEEEPAPTPVKLTAEEMRKARLARFGG